MPQLSPYILKLTKSETALRKFFCTFGGKPTFPYVFQAWAGVFSRLGDWISLLQVLEAQELASSHALPHQDSSRPATVGKWKIESVAGQFQLTIHPEHRTVSKAIVFVVKAGDASKRSKTRSLRSNASRKSAVN